MYKQRHYLLERNAGHEKPRGLVFFTSLMQDEPGPGAECWTMDKFTIGLLENLARLGGLLFVLATGGVKYWRIKNKS